MNKASVWRRAFLKNMATGVVSLILTLALVELALQFVEIDDVVQPKVVKEDWALVPERVWTEYHPELGWYHQKNKQAVMTVAGNEIPVVTNSIGLRGVREYQVNRREAYGRVAILGDSFMFGFGVHENENLAKLMENDGENLEVLNFSVPGYGIDQMLVAYRNLVRKYRPDVVLVGIFPEDFWRATRSFADSGHAKPFFKLVGDDLIQQNIPVPEQYELNMNQFPEVIKPGPVRSILLKSRLFSLVDRLWKRLGKNLGLLDPALSEEWILGRAIYGKLMNEIKLDGATPVAFLIPPDRWVKQVDDASLHKSINRFSKRENFLFLDLTPIFRQKVIEDGLEEYYIKGDWHWTFKGHQLAKASISDFLDEKGISLG